MLDTILTPASPRAGSRGPWLRILTLACILGAASRPLEAQAGGAKAITYRVRLPTSDLSVFVRRRLSVGPASPASAPVLFVHGASFPSALAADFRFDGYSWMDDFASRGFDAWALDFLGYGESDRYPEMRDPADAHPPLGRTPIAAEQIHAAVELITRTTGSVRVSVVAHSWGTIPAGRFAGEHPERVERLVLFGPIAQRESGEERTAPKGAYTDVGERDQHERFSGYVPKGYPPVLAERHFRVWGPAYMATDPTSTARTPRSVRVPSGPLADLADAWAGRLPFDPGRIRAPTLIIRGEWETVTTDADARWLFHALSGAQIRRDVKIARATHVMHLESARFQLYSEVAAFLEGEQARRKPTTIRIGGFGALSGPLRSFGLGSRAALHAAADSINRAGGLRLASGRPATLVVSYVDDRCDAQAALHGLETVIAAGAMLAVGPSCSTVAESVFRRLGSDTLVEDSTRIALPVFTDGATKAGLARLSPWAFRNVPDERTMYRALWSFVRRRYPDLRRFAGGSERDFAHSHSTWEAVIRPGGVEAGLELVAETSWSLADTTFVAAVAALRRARPDVVVLAAHEATTCGMLREMRRQRLQPRLVVGLTSAAGGATMQRCAAEAEGLVIPTTFALVNAESRAAAAAVARAGGDPNLHSMAAWEIMFAVKELLEREVIEGTAEAIVEDRRRLRSALAATPTLRGLLGPIERTVDREARKRFVLVRARGGRWEVLTPNAVPADTSRGGAR